MKSSLNIFISITSKINILLLRIITFFIPIYQKYLSPLIGLWALIAIILIILKKQKFLLNKSLITLIGFYILLTIGLLWTEDKKAGNFDLEVKLSLIIFPLLFSFLNYSKTIIKSVLLAFVMGIIVGVCYLMYHSFLIYQKNHAIDSFFYINLSTILHPSYLSLYVVTAITLIIIDLKYKVLNLFKCDKLAFVILSFLFIYNIFLLSKIGIITCLLIVTFFTTQWIITKHKYLSGGGILLTLMISMYLSYQYSPYAKQRVDEMFIGLTSFNENKSHSSTGIRIKVWEQSLILIKEKPFLGHGTGDVKKELMSKYKINQINDAYKKKLNAHNQYLEVGIAIGIVGLTLFVLIFYFGIVQSVKHKNYYVMGFIIIIILYMIPESILENQAGTVFFGLFFSLLNQKSLSKI
jgi:O-antigen ligase